MFIAEAARIFDINLGALRKALQAGSVPGYKIDGRWCIDYDEAAAYADSVRLRNVRLPLKPLENYIRFDGTGNLVPSRELAELFGVAQCVVQNWRARGVDVWTADELACRFGVNPVSVWPDWYRLEDA